MSESNPIVATYLTEVDVLGMPKGCNSDFNTGWGFTNGVVNEWKGDILVPLPGADSEELIIAHGKATSSTRIKIKVEVFKDGSKRFTIPNKPTQQEPGLGKQSGKQPRRPARP
jgi:hypothetical protein